MIPIWCWLRLRKLQRSLDGYREVPLETARESLRLKNLSMLYADLGDEGPTPRAKSLQCCSCSSCNKLCGHSTMGFRLASGLSYRCRVTTKIRFGGVTYSLATWPLLFGVFPDWVLSLQIRAVHSHHSHRSHRSHHSSFLSLFICCSCFAGNAEVVHHPYPSIQQCPNQLRTGSMSKQRLLLLLALEYHL